MEWQEILEQEEQPVPQNDLLNNLSYAGKQVVRPVVRGIETLAGSFGDILSLPPDALSYLTGGRTPSYEQIRQNPLIGFPPTSTDIRKNVTQKYTGQTFEPETETQQKVDEFTQDLIGLINPFDLTGKGKAVKVLGKAATQAGLGNLAEWGSEKIGLPDWMGKTAKIGTMLATGLYGTRGKISDLEAQKYSSALESLPDNARVNVNVEHSFFNDLYNEISKADHPDKEEILKRLQAFGNLVFGDHEVLQKAVESPVTKFLLGFGAGSSGVLGGLSNLPYTIAGAGAAYGVYKGVKEAAKAYELIKRSPTARRYYKNAIMAALNNNVRVMSSNLRKLDKVATDFQYTEPEPEQEWEEVS